MCALQLTSCLSLFHLFFFFFYRVKLTPAERKAFARSGKNKAVLIRFLRTVEDEITTPSQSTEENEDPNNLDVKSYESQLVRAISDVFNQYDSDGSGAIDLEELRYVHKSK